MLKIYVNSDLCKFLAWYSRKNAVLAFLSKILKIYVNSDLSNFWLDTLDRMLFSHFSAGYSNLCQFRSCKFVARYSRKNAILVFLSKILQIYINSDLATFWLDIILKSTLFACVLSSILESCVSYELDFCVCINY